MNRKNGEGVINNTKAKMTLQVGNKRNMFTLNKIYFSKVVRTIRNFHILIFIVIGSLLSTLDYMRRQIIGEIEEFYCST